MEFYKGKGLAARYPSSRGVGAAGVEQKAGVYIPQQGQHSAMGVEGGVAKTKRLWELS